MPKIRQVLCSIFVMALLSISPAFAWEMSQTQEVTVKGGSDTEVTVKQSQSMKSSDYNAYNNSYYSPASYPYNNPAAPIVGRYDYDKAHISWGYRGGTCYVRYTEVGESVYKYATETACDNGGITIGSLVPGQKYKFIVRQY